MRREEKGRVTEADEHSADGTRGLRRATRADASIKMRRHASDRGVNKSARSKPANVASMRRMREKAIRVDLHGSIGSRVRRRVCHLHRGLFVEGPSQPEHRFAASMSGIGGGVAIADLDLDGITPLSLPSSRTLPLRPPHPGHTMTAHVRPDERRRKNTSGDDDFLSLHLRSLLVREPSQRSEACSPQATSPTHTNSGGSATFFVSASPTPGPSRTPSAHARLGADEYFGLACLATTPASPNSMTSITTSFGKRPSPKAILDRTGKGTNPLEPIDDSNHGGSSGQTASSSRLQRRGSLQTYRSDSAPTSDDTEITTPLSSSEGSVSHEQPGWAELKQSKVVSCQGGESDDDESGDQTTWRRFKEGGVIEPPEVEWAALTAPWWNQGDRGLADASGRHTSMTSSRRHHPHRHHLRPSRTSPLADTLTAERSTMWSGSQGVVSLVPQGNDKRTFRFVNGTGSARTVSKDVSDTVSRAYKPRDGRTDDQDQLLMCRQQRPCLHVAT